jgi:hypothetical protein
MTIKLNFMDVSKPLPAEEISPIKRVALLNEACNGLTELGHHIDKCRYENSGKGLTGVNFLLERTGLSLKAWIRPFVQKAFLSEEEKDLPENGIEIEFMPTHINLRRIKKYMQTKHQYQPASGYRTLQELRHGEEKPIKNVVESRMEFLGQYTYSEEEIQNMAREAGRVIREKCLPEDFAPVFKKYLEKIQISDNEKISEPGVN